MTAALLAPVVHTAALRGIEQIPVEVSCIVEGGLPQCTIVGLSEAAVRETRVRVQSAIVNAGFLFPVGRMTVTVNAGHAKIDGTGFDLPIALAILASTGQIDGAHLDGWLVFGELSLAGEVRPVRGASVLASDMKLSRCVCAVENAREAALTSTAYGVRTLLECVRHLAGTLDTAGGRLHPVMVEPTKRTPSSGFDMSDVRGQSAAIRAIEIAAVAGLNVMLIGGPGAGKTMLARRVCGILPPLDDRTRFTVTQCHSVAGLTVGIGGLVADRPFRAPHHSTTPPGLVGGGAAQPRPGEITLAHCGVLFLDEVPEFSRAALEALREPTREGEVVLARATGTIRFPARPAMIIGSMSPCPCGRNGSKTGPACRCTAEQISRYMARVPWDLFPVVIHVDSVDLAALDGPPGETSETIAIRIASARARMAPLGHPSHPVTALTWAASCLDDRPVDETHIKEAGALHTHPIVAP